MALLLLRVCSTRRMINQAATNALSEQGYDIKT